MSMNMNYSKICTGTTDLIHQKYNHIGSPIHFLLLKMNAATAAALATIPVATATPLTVSL